MNTHLNPQTYEALLLYYAEAGMVDFLDDNPIDRFAETQELANARRQALGIGKKPSQQTGQAGGTTQHRSTARPVVAAQPPQTNQIAIPSQASIENANQLAKAANSIEELQQAISGFEGCNLKQGAKNTVFADGNPDADIMFIGEAPAGHEDREGLPFVGPAGQLLDKMLAAISLDRTNVYLTNIIPWRPPGNRNPTPHEITLCRPFVARHIELAQPKLLVFLGNISSKNLLDTQKGILSLRGQWHSYKIGENEVPAMPTLHPSYLLRNPAAKRHSWADLLSISAKLGEISAK